MRLTSHLYLVGSGQIGLSDASDCHVYLVRGPEGLVLIDAGGGQAPEQILANVRAEGFDPGGVQALLLTHWHFDHAGGAWALREATGCQVFCPDVSRALLENATAEEVELPKAQQMGLYPPEFTWRNCPVDRAVADGDRLRVAGLEFQALRVTGHSPDATAYRLEVDGWRGLFCGDILYQGGLLGLINWEGSTLEGYRRDLPKLADLEIDGLLSGHLLFILQGGQKHIDLALKALQGAFVPLCIGQVGRV